MNPNYLTPDTVEKLSERFSDESSLQLSELLSKSFAEKLKAEIGPLDKEHSPYAPSTNVARPPHKHRFHFWQQNDEGLGEGAHSALVGFLTSVAFKKWLQLVTGGSNVPKANILARRFRRGQDYTLATGYEEPDPRLELCLNISPTEGWTTTDEEVEDAESSGNAEEAANAQVNGETGDEQENYGGYEVYMAGDDDEDEHEVTAQASTMTGAGKRGKADPAIYRAANNDDDGGILFSNPPSWNTMSIVLRDKGVLRFVKYVSRSAPGDRWDVTGEYEVSWPDSDDEELK
jgi:prolyl 3-hydroxylase /prolyl 3,4-dihydroxylase